MRAGMLEVANIMWRLLLVMLTTSPLMSHRCSPCCSC